MENENIEEVSSEDEVVDVVKKVLPKLSPRDLNDVVGGLKKSTRNKLMAAGVISAATLGTVGTVGGVALYKHNHKEGNEDGKNEGTEMQEMGKPVDPLVNELTKKQEQLGIRK